MQCLLRRDGLVLIGDTPLTAWGGALLERTVRWTCAYWGYTANCMRWSSSWGDSQMGKKSPAFYWIRRFITVFKRAATCHCPEPDEVHHPTLFPVDLFQYYPSICSQIFLVVSSLTFPHQNLFPSLLFPIRGDPCGAVRCTAPQGSPRTCIAAITPGLIVRILNSVFFFLIFKYFSNFNEVQTYSLMMIC